MERLFRLIFFILFIVGFVGVVASADRTPSSALVGASKEDTSAILSLVQDTKLADQIDQINRDPAHANWDQDISDLRQDSLARVENLLESKPELDNTQK